jgi:hypothetical protein
MHFARSLSVLNCITADPHFFHFFIVPLATLSLLPLRRSSLVTFFLSLLSLRRSGPVVTLATAA